MASASIGDPQSLNLFAYTQNNPVDFVDPSGLYIDASSCVLVCAQSFDKDGNPTGPKDCEYRCEEAKIVESDDDYFVDNPAQQPGWFLRKFKNSTGARLFLERLYAISECSDTISKLLKLMDGTRTEEGKKNG